MLKTIRKPILQRLLIILFVAMFTQFFLSLGLNVFGYYLDLTESTNRSIETKLDKLRTSIERILSLGIPVTDIPQFNQELEKEIREDFLRFIAVVDPTGIVLYHSDPILTGTKLPLDRTKFDEAKELEAVIFPYNYVKIVARPVKDARSKSTAYLIAAYQPEHIYKKVFLVFLRMSFSSAIAGFLGIFLILYFYRRQIDRPLTGLLEHVERIKDGFFGEMETPDRKNELSAIVQAINRMSRELNTAFGEKEALLERIRNEEEKLRKIIEKTEIGIAVVRDEHVVFLNPGFFKVFGLDPERAIVGARIFDFFVDQEVPFYRDIFREVIDTGRKRTFDLVKLVDSGGSEIFCSLEISLLETSEWGRRLLSLTFQNVTEKVKFTDELKAKNRELEQLIAKYQSSQLALQVTNEKLENALITIEKANEELKKLDNIKDVFFSTISHELKTPISLIQGYIGILKNDATIKSSSMTLDILGAVDRAARRLVGLTEEIMELMRIKSGKLTLNTNLTYLGLVINPLVTEMAPLLDNKKIRMTTHNIDQLPIVSIDAKKIETAFRNIFVNCIKFSREGGSIRVSGEVVAEHGRQCVHIAVQDEGCGISKINLEKIFSEFFMMSPPPSVAKDSTIRGSGLGLSIAKGVVEAHGGRVWAESPGYDPDAFPGSTFHIVIPVNG